MTEPWDTRAPITATLDPRSAETPAHLAAMLTTLKERSGRSYAEMAVYAESEGHRCDMRALMRVVSGPLPERDALLAYLAGAGLDRDERRPWIRAHTRLEDIEHAHVDRRASEPQQPAPAATAAPRPDDGLDPDGAETPEQLIELLTTIKDRCGRAFRKMAHHAQAEGLAASHSRICAVLNASRFPSETGLIMFLAGAGVPEAHREPWLVARKRLADIRRGNIAADRPERAKRRGPEIPVPQPPRTGAPNPAGVRTPTEFTARLLALLRWSGLDVLEVVNEAAAAGHSITRAPIQYALTRRLLPHADTVAAITAGCGLNTDQRRWWESTRSRLAALPASAHRIPPAPTRSTAKSKSRTAPTASASPTPTPGLGNHPDPSSMARRHPTDPASPVASQRF